MSATAPEPARRVRQWPAALLALAALFVLFSLTFGVRWFVVQPFRQPSGSMQPTLARGDFFLAQKWAYGYGRYSFAPFDGLIPRGRWFARLPNRGDIVVFRPEGESRDFVKRIVGLPGDRIQMIDGVLQINGAPVKYEAAGSISITNPDGPNENVPGFREMLPNGVSYIVLDRHPDWELDNTRVFTVPAGHYFMLGDDRDNSQDSRTVLVSYVPFDNLVGRANRTTDAVVGLPPGP